VAAEVVSLDKHGRRARARVRLEWRVPGVGPWSYETRITLREAGGEWRVRWAPSLVHPRVERDTRLGTVRFFPERAPILDCHGGRLVAPRPVVLSAPSRAGSGTPAQPQKGSRGCSTATRDRSRGP
jgi:hypothetical protein